MMKRFIVVLTSILLVGGGSLYAQNKKITGSVRDENGDVLSGAIVVVKSAKEGVTKQTTTTDVLGKYSVDASGSDFIEIHFLGYNTYSEQVKNRNKIDVSLELDAAQKLDDVIVIGYGAVKAADLTGSVTNVKMSEIRNEPVLSIDQALQGRVAGLEITSTDGEPGSDSVLRIRGSRSITASNDPLIVVDGVMDAVTSLSDINPSDIESISVLKDASSTAIYGARGSNGVIIITTKGSDDSVPQQKISVTLRANAGVSLLPGKLDLMNAEQYGIYRNEYYQHNGLSGNMNMQTPISELSVKAPFDWATTDWIGDITRPAPYQNYNLSLNGFQGKQKFYASLGYNDEQGIILKSGQQNYTATLNLSNKAFDWLTLNCYVRYQYRTQDNNLTAIGGGGIYYGAMYLSPLIDPGDSYNPLNNAGTQQSNAVVRIQQNTDHTNRSMLTISPGATVRITSGLYFKTKFSYYFFDRQRYKYWPSTLPSRTDEQGGEAYRENYQEQSFYTENTLSYDKKFDGGHNFDAMLGQSWKKYLYQNFNLSGEGYLVDDMMWNNMAAVTDKQSYGADTEFRQKAKLAFFARVNYNWKSRYYLTVTGRADAASNFAANHKWGFFPSMALKWNIGNEPFMDNVSWVDNLALRFSVGQSGNDLNAPYRSLARLDADSGGYAFAGQKSQEYWQARIASPNLTWETTTSYNLALDASFMNNKLSFTLEGYYSDTKDLLLTVKVPQSTGYDNKYANVGSTTSKGIEFSMSSRNIVKRNFTWTTDFTISHANSIVNDLGVEAQVSQRNSPEGGYMMVGYRVGYPVNSFWGFQYAGVWHNQDEIDRNKVTHSVGNPASSTKLGYPVYVDQNHDGTLDSSDIVYLGSPDPVVAGGLQNTFRFKGLSLGIFFSYGIGGKVWNYSEFYMAGSRRTNQYAYMVNAWHPLKNPDSNLPRAGITDGAAPPSSLMVHDASFLRLKSLSLSYRFNVKSKVLREIEVSASGENLWMLSSYNGFDPDVSSGGTNRLDVASYPKARRVVFSIQLKY